jgi:hypothetical protein
MILYAQFCGFSFWQGHKHYVQRNASPFFMLQSVVQGELPIEYVSASVDDVSFSILV